MSRELLALTVLQPFASAIARFGKDVENRTWLPGARLPVGGWLAIHAGMCDYPGAFSDAAAKACPWAVPGMEQWRFGRVFALPEPVPCKGAQGLWRVPDDVAARVRAQWTPFALAPEAP